LVAKRRKGHAVGHSLTELAQKLLTFCRSLE
jgi:hypothetical protein